MLKQMRKNRARGVEASTFGGKMLVAMPGMGDDRFKRSVIYVCAHSIDGAMGIVLNKRANDMTFSELLVQLDVIEAEDAIRLPRRVSASHVLRGGPVETSRGFVLHTTDFSIEDSTMPINDGIALTATLDILRAIAAERGPASSVLALGYAGWGPGQLEREFSHNGWLHAPADPELIFSTDLEGKYQRALARIGIDASRLSETAGHG
jgi:putative transcriptional regulator